jgi:hypothetical protein
MGERSRSRGVGVVGLLALACTLLGTTEAAAHIKWFCSYDVAEQPRGLASVFCAQFWELVGLAIVLLLMACALEPTFLGEALLRALDRVTRWIRLNTELLMRGTCAFFFIALWKMGGVLLTPELKTTSALVPWLQLTIAACLLSRATLPLAALGIAVLYALAEWNYGAFHLMDYPIFLGIALYLALAGLKLEPVGAWRQVDVLRWGAAITLMWASVEKWAYPDWSFPLLTMYPEMKMGFDQELYMRAAGVVEFTLAFALLWTPLVRRAAALMLAGMFTSAIFEFGVLDAIGHSAIIAVMLAVAADNARPHWRRRTALLVPLAYAAALIATLLPYYGGHALIYQTVVM